ncbi:MAG: ATP synthase F1 subunit epsilon [Chitinophagales bacterium]|jgi:F-type H+-transporting ATPase subunit epsilon|nr:ATP synthase F1 subunit epsilon [Chitinophagales bacterium]
MTLEILTPEKKIYSGDASSVTLPGIDGKFQLLEKHAPIISALGKGKVVYKSSTGVSEIEITGGFAECQNNKVIVLVEGALA